MAYGLLSVCGSYGIQFPVRVAYRTSSSYAYGLRISWHTVPGPHGIQNIRFAWHTDCGSYGIRIPIRMGAYAIHCSWRVAAVRLRLPPAMQRSLHAFLSEQCYSSRTTLTWSQSTISWQTSHLTVFEFIFDDLAGLGSHAGAGLSRPCFCRRRRIALA
jgi:hypothetical protein